MQTDRAQRAREACGRRDAIGRRMFPKAQSMTDFFLSRISKSDRCWIWASNADREGYGRVYDRRKGKMVRAHRLAYELFVGEIPKGGLVLHRCDTPLCVNPEHLFIGDDADNIIDSMLKGRRAVGSRHPRSKLSDAQVSQIRASTEPERAGAKRFGISSAQFGKIRKGRARIFLSRAKPHVRAKIAELEAGR